MPRTEADALVQQMTARIREIADVVPTLMTRAEASVLLSRDSERVRELTDRINRSDGQGQGAKENRSGLIALIAAAVGVITIVVFVANMLSGS
jgi:hypothetical protein